MFSEAQFYQIITLLFAIAVFDFMERRRPGFLVDRKRDLFINILAIAVVIVAGEWWKRLILQGFSLVSLVDTLRHTSLPRLPGALKIFLAVILTDFSLYWVHRAMHTPLLWRTHAFHHSIAEIWWLAGSRTSVIHLFLFAVPQILIGYYILVLSVWQAGVCYSFAVLVNIWIHTNLWVDLGWLEWLFITPNFHRIHHGSGGNLGFVVTVWDRMFGTYVDPKVLGKEFAVNAVPTEKKLLRLVVGL